MILVIVICTTIILICIIFSRSRCSQVDLGSLHITRQVELENDIQLNEVPSLVPTLG